MGEKEAADLDVKGAPGCGFGLQRKRSFRPAESRNGFTRVEQIDHSKARKWQTKRRGRKRRAAMGKGELGGDGGGKCSCGGGERRLTREEEEDEVCRAREVKEEGRATRGDGLVLAIEAIWALDLLII
ncbi:hypothetical protein Droror1_Dr00023395 [Drosera rotundifolia]